MTMTIPLGFWAIPLAVTLAAFGWYAVWEWSQPPSYGYGKIGAGLGSAIMFLLALFVSGVAWFIWALVT